MNTTNQSLEQLQKLCAIYDLRLLPRQPLCRQNVIDAIEREIRHLHNSPAASGTIHSGDHLQWKQKLEALQSHLTDLRQPEIPTPPTNANATDKASPHPTPHVVPASAGSP